MIETRSAAQETIRRNGARVQRPNLFCRRESCTSIERAALFRLISPFTHQWEKARRIAARFSHRCRQVARYAKRMRYTTVLSSCIFAPVKRTLSSVGEQAVRFDDLKDAEMKRRQRGAEPHRLWRSCGYSGNPPWIFVWPECSRGEESRWLAAIVNSSYVEMRIWLRDELSYCACHRYSSRLTSNADVIAEKFVIVLI